MLHARVSEVYIHFAFIYTTDHIFILLPIKYLINEDSNQTNTYKLTTDQKPLLCVEVGHRVLLVYINSHKIM